MTPKEKAEELINEFIKLTSKHEKLETAGLGAITLAKQCAFVAVDEILNEYPSQCPKDSYEMERHLYWQEVKQEIEKP